MHDDRPRTVDLFGANNETVSFRFAVHADCGPMERATLRMTPLISSAGSIDSSAVQVFRMHRVGAGRLPGWHIRYVDPADRDAAPFDVLVPIRAPRGGLPDVIDAGETLYFWADVSIPKGTAAGTYSGRIELVQDTATTDVVGLAVAVWPFSLPAAGDVAAIVELDHRALFRHHIRRDGRPFAPVSDDWRGVEEAAQLDSLLTSTIRMFDAHGVTAVLPDLAPPMMLDTRGSVVIDWAPYDKIVTPLMSGGALFSRQPLRHWPLPLRAVLDPTTRVGDSRSSAYEGLLSQYAAQCVDHFTERGWLERAYGLISISETTLTASRSAVRSVAETLQRVASRLPLAITSWPQDMAPYGWIDYVKSDLESLTDIWVTPAQYCDGPTIAREQDLGRRSWMVADRPPFSGTTSIHGRPEDQRVLSWQARSLGVEALFLGAANHWPSAATSPRAEDCVRFDSSVLIYPGRRYGLDTPVVSVRLKHLRQSLVDSAYRALLDEYGLGRVVDMLTRTLAGRAGTGAYRTHFADGRPIGWERDERRFDSARRIMGLTLMDALGGAVDRTRAEALVQTTAWRRLTAGTSHIRAQLDGARIRFRGTHSVWAAELECAVTISNETPLPITGEIRFGDLPEGWAADATSIPFPSIPLQGTRRVTLTAQITTLPTTANGALEIPIDVLVSGHDDIRVPVRVSCITAVQPPKAMAIDGRLDDWPPTATNTAGQFRLAVSARTGDRATAPSDPKRRTFAFAIKDRQNLYLAVNSEFDGGRSTNISRNNMVAYDDLVPTGDELVEILIDPTNSGTHSPSDLYHIVVKPSGAYVVEKGIRTSPPCADRQPWPADIRVATHIERDRWTVEMALPLSDFNVSAARNAVWGLNIVRYDVEHQELSSWSGATGSVYDPMALGNIYFP